MLISHEGWWCIQLWEPWYGLRKILSPYPSPLTPILCTLAFQPGLKDPYFVALLQQGFSKILHFSLGNQLMTSREVERSFIDLDFLWRAQLSMFLQLLPTVVRAPSVFEQLCLRGEPLRHSLSHFYASLIRLKARFPTIVGKGLRGYIFSGSEGQDLTVRT